MAETKATLDDLLARLDDLDNKDLAKQFRQVITTQADQIREQGDQLATFQRKERTAVLKDAGVSEAAYDRFLRDWDAEHADSEFVVDKVKAAAAAMGYALTDGTTTPQVDEAAKHEQDAARRLAAAQSDGVVLPGTPPDAKAQASIAEQAIKPGDRQSIQTSMAAKRALLPWAETAP
jgi:hypothetical protein